MTLLKSFKNYNEDDTNNEIQPAFNATGVHFNAFISLSTSCTTAPAIYVTRSYRRVTSLTAVLVSISHFVILISFFRQHFRLTSFRTYMTYFDLQSCIHHCWGGQCVQFT